MINVHLGGGKRYLLNYIHVDLADYSHIDYKHNIFELPMFEDNSVDLIYASHCFEYADREQAKDVLKEWKRILKIEGILRLAVPDAKALMELYQETKQLEKIIGPLYGRWPINDDQVFYHKTVYDFFSLAEVLYRAGFSRVRYWDWKKVFVGDLEGFDDYSKAYQPHLNFESGKLMSLNIECVKDR